MKRLVALILTKAFVLIVSAQESCPAPLDVNQDGVIGITDMLNILSVFADSDTDFDGVWDSVDDCVGSYDECGVCNGSGANIPILQEVIVWFDSVYIEQLSEWYVFEAGSDSIYTFVCDLEGCTDQEAENFNPLASINDGTCVFPFENCGDLKLFDGHAYRTIQIGGQCWFAENLRSERFANGDGIASGLSDEDWSNTDVGAVAAPFADSPSQAEYGGMYNWHAVHDDRGLCPTGWHVPSDGEWMTLEVFCGLSTDELYDTGFRGLWDQPGLKLKAASGWITNNGTNESGFEALPGGTKNWNCAVNGYGDYGFFWSSTQVADHAWTRGLYDGGGSIYRNNQSHNVAMSVRCVAD